MLNGEGWNLIYWHNHDHPRILSHYGNDSVYHNESGKMLAYILYMMPGTPIVYQGEEIGMTNVDYENLTDFRDVEVYTEYDNFLSFGATHEVAMQTLRDRSRDNARSPFQWDSSINAGFSSTTPWMNVNRNFSAINLEKQIKDETSIYSTYKSLFKLRKEENISDGILEFIDIENDSLFIYTNETKTAIFLVVSNFTTHKIMTNLDIDINGYENIYNNYTNRELNKEMKLLPYEALVYKKKK
jgi:glycosidase